MFILNMLLKQFTVGLICVLMVILTVIKLLNAIVSCTILLLLHIEFPRALWSSFHKKK